MSKLWKFLRLRGVESRQQRQSVERSLSTGFEVLEDRLVLSADGLFPLDAADEPPAVISPIWFEQISTSALAAIESGSATLEESTERLAWQDRSLDVFSNEWIVQLDWSALTDATTITEASSLFAVGDVDFEIIGGLGIGGQMLIHTAEDATVTQIDAWLGGSEVVTYYEPNALLPIEQTPNDSSYSQLWGLNNTGQTGGTVDADIDAPEAWNISTGSSDIVVAVIDTGVDYTHPDLAANIWTNPGEIAGNGIDDDGNGFIDDVHGYDFVNNDGDPMDDNSHGTHVAGTIAGAGNNGTGVTGVNWNSSIMALKFLSASGSGSIANAAKAVNYATMMKTMYDVNVKATNNSWGGGGYSQAMYDAIAASGDADILFIAAAGNSANNNDASPHYPSTYSLDNVIAVAATDQNDNLAYFSSYGATTVDLAAPGVSTYSTVPGGGYASYSGTSMATPHVTGVAALAWSVMPDASAAQIKAAILGGVDSLASLDGKVLTGGRLNALNTLEALGMSVAGSSISDGSTLSTAPKDFTIDFTHAYNAASIDTWDFRVNGTAASSFTLVDSDTIIFHYNLSPVMTEGAQTMQIDQNAITRAGTSEGINAWQSGFFYDQQVLTVTSATPTLGEVLTSAPAYIDLNFNEAVNAASIDASDLTLSEGSVLAVTAYDADTVRFTVIGLPADGEVTYSLAAGALSDVAGSPGAAFTSNFVIDNPYVERYGSSGAPVQIVDNTTVTSTINVTGAVKIVDLNVALDITHTYDWDLQVYLISPDGTRVQLFSNVGGSGDNFTNTVLDDEASTLISSGSAPFSGRYRPEGLLADFDGVSVAGTWTLEVTDVFSVDNGTIDDWELIVQHDGMSVIGSNPGDGQTLTTALTDFTVDFTYDVDAATLDAADYSVDGNAADGFTLVDNNTVMFHYNTSPYSADGVHQMAIAAGAISSTSGINVNAWQDTFYFDQLTLEVVSTNVADGAIVAAPPTSIEFNFNEAIDPASLNVGDLQLSSGTVTGVTVVDADTVRFDVSIPSDDTTLIYTIAAGAITDAAGTPNAEFARSFTIDDPTVFYYTSGNINLGLPDNGWVDTYLTVAEDVDILDVNVELDISHTWDADLDVYLIAPNGKVIELFTDVGGSGENFTGTVLDDEASVAIRYASAPFSGRYRPEGLLSAVDGDSAQGVWTLRVGDDFASDTGVLNSWGLAIRGNLPPDLAPIADQTMSYSDGSLVVPITVSDANGDALTLTAEVLSGSTEAYDLDQQLGFYTTDSLTANNFYENYRGAGEKYILAANSGGSHWYFILPNGALYQWGGSIGASTLVATLDAGIHADPSLLYDAQPGGNALVTLSLDQQTGLLTITPDNGFLDEFNVRVTADDGMSQSVETFNVNVVNQTPLMDAITNQTMSYSDGSLVVPIVASDADGDALTLSAEVLSGSTEAYDLDQQLGFYTTDSLTANNFYENYRGAGEKYILAANSAGSHWYFILPNGELYQWGGSIGASTLVATLDASIHADPSLLYDAQPGGNAQVTLSLDQQTGMLTITPDNGYLGDFTVHVTADDGVNQAEQTFQVSVTNQVPLMDTITDQTMSYSDGSLVVPIIVSDADGDALTLSAEVLAGSTQAYDLDQQLGFYTTDSLTANNFYENYRGAGEKYILAANASGSQWHFILPNGELYHWGGSIGASTLVATLDASIHADLSLLYDAQPGGNALVTLSLDQQTGMLTVTPDNGYLGDFNVRVTASDGVSQAEQIFQVSVTNQVPLIDAISDQAMNSADGSLVVPITASDADGDALTLTAEVLAGSTQAYELDQQLGFYTTDSLTADNFYENYRGAGEKYILAANSAGSHWYFILPNGELYHWGGSIGASTLAATLDASIHADPSLLYDAQPGTAAATLSLDQQTGMLTITPDNGYLGDFNVRVTASDGVSQAERTFKVSVSDGSTTATSLYFGPISYATAETSETASAGTGYFYAASDSQTAIARISRSVFRDRAVSNAIDQLDFSKSALAADRVDGPVNSTFDLRATGNAQSNRVDSERNDHQQTTNHFETTADEVYSWLGDDDGLSLDLRSLDDAALGTVTSIP